MLGISRAVPDAIFVLSAAAWLVLAAAYATQGPRQMLGELRDPVLAPFASAAVITPMILAAEMATYARFRRG